MKTTYKQNLLAAALSLACFCFLFGDPVLAQKPTPQKAAGRTLTIDAAEMQKPWTGDLDGMIAEADHPHTHRLQQDLLFRRQGRTARLRG